MKFNLAVKVGCLAFGCFVVGWFIASLQCVHNPSIAPVVDSSVNFWSQPRTTKAPIPSDCFIYQRDEKEWKPSNITCGDTSKFMRTTLHTSSGDTPIFIYDPQIDKWVSGSLYRDGRWEPQFVDIISNILRADNDLHFIDLGTNLGVFALSVAKMNRQVLAVDALAMNIERLCASIKAGNFTKNIKVVYNALSDVREMVSLGVDKGNVGGTFVAKDKNQNKVKGSEVGGNYGSVQTAKLDDMLELPGFNAKKAVIKIDVEGYENRVFRGGEEFFKRVNVTAVLMEWLWLKTGPEGQEIVEFFKRHNFEATVPTDRRVLPIDQRGQWPNDVLWRKKV
ncbi:uncharacterized protein LOC133171633 [Saccostrea echinata]|uniref:uncharacterized protein LOC133171633 n=1 Tax=Saccostrea echinata TaxID=191078 RepID=UPI002A839A52|nr:uncharacterized protein LOC133171633 [Saccostrea echinata]